MSELPPGFVLDQPQQPMLPPGFVLDKPSIGADVAKSIGGGLVDTTAGTAAMIPAISSAAHGLANRYLFDPLFNAISGPPKQSAEAPPDVNKMALNAINNVSAPYNYEPQTAYGSAAKTATELAAMAGGGEGSLLSKALTRVAAPTAASEAAGALTQGTAAEPYARLGATIGSMAGAERAANKFAQNAALKAATPDLAALKSTTSGGYDALTANNIATPLRQGALDSLADDIKSTLNSKGIRPSNAASIHAGVEELRTPATAGAPDVADLVAARQSIKENLKDPSTNKAGAFIALDKIDQAIEKASPGTMQKLKQLDTNWAAVRANEALDKRIARAELQNSGAHSGMNLGNTIRQKVRSYLDSNEARYLSEENRADLEKLVHGTWTQNGFRLAGNLMGGGGGLGSTLLGVTGAVAGEKTGHPELAALPFVGFGMRKAFNAAVARQAEKVAQNIRMRSPMGQANLSPTMPSNILPGVTLPNPNFVSIPQGNPTLARGALPALLQARKYLPDPNAAP